MILPICINKKPYKPEAQQIAFHKSGAKFRAFFGGFGCGKSVAGCVEAVKNALQFPGSRGLIGRYTDRELRQTTWQDFLNILPEELIEDYNKARLHLTLKNKTEVLGMHLQNEERLRSLNLDWGMVDESCEVGESIYNQLLARLRGGIGPRRIWLVGNPEGQNWIYKKFVAPWEDGCQAPNHEYFQGRTVDVSFLPVDYVEALFATYDEEWATRFIQGSWAVFKGQVYPMFNREVHVLPGDFRIPKEWPKFLGVDHGWTDPTAAVMIAADFEGNYYIYDGYYRKLTTIEDNAKAILKQSEGTQFTFQVLAPFSDKTEPGTGKKFSDLYRDAGLPLQEQRSRVMAGIGRVRELMEPRAGRRHPTNRKAAASPKIFVLSHLKHVINEFQAYRFPSVSDDKNAADKPLDRDNHCMDAIRAVIMFNPGAEEERMDDGWETYFDHLQERFLPKKAGYQDIIGNERCY